MKSIIALVGMALFVCGTQVVLSDQASTRLLHKTQSMNSTNGGLWGACCLQDGTCEMDYVNQCFSSWGGVFMEGDCAENPCNTLLGACCDPDSSNGCLIMSEYDCFSTFGGGASFIVDVIDCGDVSCELNGSGACCWEDDTCDIVSHDADCWSGIFHRNLSCEQVICQSSICPPDSMFGTIAYPFSVECGNQQLPFSNISQERIDLDGDHNEEMIIDIAMFTSNGPVGNENNRGLVVRTGNTVGTIKITELIDLNPAAIAYVGMQFYESITCELRYLFDVTGDGLPDAIVLVSTSSMEPMISNDAYYYIENISTPTTTACAADSNADGIVDITDLLAVVGSWGTCP